MSEGPPSEYIDTLKRHGFALGERLGGGAYGTVYKADQGTLRRPVAVKFFDKKGMRTDANRKRFEREAPLLARVQHPAVPYVITTGTVKGLRGDVPYTVMQFVSGPRLDEQIKAGKVPVQLVRRVMRDVLSALEGAHGHGVIHRDVKPDNIIVSEHGTYLLDFSIGFCVEMVPGLSRATDVGDHVGTWDYAAPEQLKDSSNVTAKADIYSAGVVLAEMLGARPRLRHDRLDLELSGVSQRLKDLIRKATSETPDDRYESAAAFQSALDRVLGESSLAWLEKCLVLCPNTGCSAARWSNGDSQLYYWGPKVVGPTNERHCEACGTEYVRGCSRCQRPLPENLEKLVAKSVKSHRDAIEAFCSGCGTILFRTPTCAKCGSYLTKEDMGKDTSKGCYKCKKKAQSSTYGGYGRPAAPPVVDEAPPAPDDDIPF